VSTVGSLERCSNMARLPRIDVPGVPQHLIVRGNNRSTLFQDDADRCIYLQFLEGALDSCACELHAYVLMSNHVHLLATGHLPGEVSELMQRVGRKFARLMNIRWNRTGTLFEGRFHSSLVDSEAYLLTCMRYIELNPVRAGMVRHPKEYGWSSYRQNAGGDPGALLRAHELYVRLGSTPGERAVTYRALVESGVSDEDLTRIRTSAAKCRALGSEKFCEEIAERLERPVVPQARGRPKKGTGSKINLTPFHEPVEELAVPEA
jgi:putative transposase